QLNAIVAGRFGECDSGEAMKLLDDAGIANAGVNDIDEFLAHPVLSARDRWRDVRIPGGAVVSALLPPADLAGTVPRMDAVPAAGEHTGDILAELGYSTADIDRMRADHVI
ncbi:CoA transferase, partial [Streptomyces decoyicus]